MEIGELFGLTICAKILAGQHPFTENSLCAVPEERISPHRACIEGELVPSVEDGGIFDTIIKFKDFGNLNQVWTLGTTEWVQLKRRI